MEIQENIVNKVAQSGLITIDLTEIFPPGERVFYDIKDNLFQGLMLREKDFRTFIKEHNVLLSKAAEKLIFRNQLMLILPLN